MRRVLVVEDELLLREDIAYALRDAGWRVVECSKGEDAVTLLLTGYRVDVLFTDIQLAGLLSGWDVAEACRRVRADFPIVYASGNAADRSRRVHASLFFDKPYQHADILAACDRLIEGPVPSVGSTAS